MSFLIPPLLRRAAPSIGAAKPREDGVRGWLVQGSFYIDDVPVDRRLTLKSVVASEFVSFLAWDYQRFAFSSFESLAACKPDVARPRALGWPLLKAYYAGFFGAHALLRAIGCSVVRIESAQAKHLTTLGQTYTDPSFRFLTGTYTAILTRQADGSWNVLLSPIDEDGGAHFSFWKVFAQFLGDFVDEVVKDEEPNALEIVAQAMELKSLLTAKGGSTGAWLSDIRNLINYQHKFGVWFPFGASQTEVDYLAKLDFRTLPNARLDFDQRKRSIEAFCAGATFIARLSYDLTQALVEGERQNMSLNRRWQRLHAEIGEKF